MDTATRSLTGLMDSLAKAPIGETVEELRAAVHSAGSLLGGPATTQAMASLSTTLVELDKTMRTVSGEAGPMIRALRQASESVAAIGSEAGAALQPGMTLEADVLIETRRIHEWVLDPLHALRGGAGA